MSATFSLISGRWPRAALALLIALATGLTLSGGPTGPATPAFAQGNFARFAGPWFRHEGGLDGTSMTLTVAPNGSGVFEWSIHGFCDDTTRPSCAEPQVVEFFAGQAAISFTSIRESTAYGTVVATDDARLFAVGEPVWLTLLPSGMAILSRVPIMRQQGWIFCGPNMGSDYPPGFLEGIPCGS